MIYLLGYPRSGNNWIRTIVQKTTNISQIQKTHFAQECSNTNVRLLLALRNYKESLVRHTEKITLSSLKEDIDEKDVNYIKILRKFDEWPEQRRLLVYYEDLIEDGVATASKIAIFSNRFNLEKFEHFRLNYQDIRQNSINGYKPGSFTKGKKKIHHSAKIDINQQIQIDNYLKEKYPNLYEKYLFRYETKNVDS